MTNYIKITTMEKICKNCMDFISDKNQCSIRFRILKDKTRIPLKRTPKQKGCKVFLYK